MIETPNPSPHSAAANLVYWLEQATRDAVVLQYIGTKHGGACVRHDNVTHSMGEALKALQQLNEFIKEYANAG